jgi:ketosteroid isomerase-like protein
MEWTRFAVAVVLLVTCAVPTVAQQDGKSKADKTSGEVEKAYRAYQAAAVRQDKETLLRALAEDYTLINHQGKVKNRQQVVEQLTSPNIKWKSITPTELKVRVYGTTALVTTLCTEKGTAGGVGSFTVRVRYSAVLVNQAGQ